MSLVTGPHPATAAIRLAVRAALAECDARRPRPRGLQWGSGLARARGCASPSRRRRLALRAGAVVVDHGLQPELRAVAATAGRAAARPWAWTRSRSSRSRWRTVGRGPRGGGQDGPLRRPRRRPPTGTARASCCSGTPSTTRPSRCSSASPVVPVPGPSPVCRGPATASGVPSSACRREQTRASCAAEGLTWWDDPMNEDPAFTRVRARRALVDLERDLGPGVAAALARTADQLREDADHLDALAEAAVASLGAGPVGRSADLAGAAARRAHPGLAAARRRGRCAGRAGEHPAYRGVRRAAHATGTGRDRSACPAPARDPQRWAGIHRRPASG